MFDFNLIGLFLATLSAPLLGFVWYHPRIFGGVWVRLVNISPENLEKSKRQMPLLTLGAFVAAFFMAFISANILTHFRGYWGILDVQDALGLALLAWSGFVVPILLGPIFWEGKSIKLFAINAGYWLTVLSVMALIIAFFV